MRGVWLSGLAVCVGAEASAGPWGRDPGEAYGRVALAAEELEGLTAYRYDVFTEYGLSRDWTAIAKVELVEFPDADDFTADGYRASVRRKIWQKRGFQLAAEAGAVYGAAIGGVRGCEEIGGELRLSAGASGAIEGLDWFGFVDVGGRAHGAGCWRERMELGFGQEIFDNVFLISQAWLERGSDEARSDKLETALLYRVGDIDFSIAYREEFSGRFDERGIVFAVASRF